MTHQAHDAVIEAAKQTLERAYEARYGKNFRKSPLIEAIVAVKTAENNLVAVRMRINLEIEVEKQSAGEAIIIWADDFSNCSIRLPGMKPVHISEREVFQNYADPQRLANLVSNRLGTSEPFSWHAGYNQHKGTTEKELLDARAKKSEGEKAAEQEMNAFIEKHKPVAAVDYKEAVARIEAEIEKQLGGSITFFYNESVGVGFHLAGVGKNVIISPLEVIQNCDNPDRIANLVKARLYTAEKSAANERSKMVQEHMPKSLELLASLPENEGQSTDDIANALTGAAWPAKRDLVLDRINDMINGTETHT